MKSKEVKAIIKASGKTQTEMATKIGLTQEHLNRLLSSNDDFPDHYLLLIKKAIKNFDELIPSKSDAKKVPIYNVDASAGNITVFQEDGSEYITGYIEVPAFSDCQMYIVVSGNSMYPKYCAGELIALKRVNDLDVIAWGEAHLIVTKEKRLLKFLTKGEDDDNWILKSENPKHQDIKVHRSKVVFLYEIKGKITKNLI